MKHLIIATFLALVVTLPARAGDDDIIKVPAQGDVATTMDRLQAVVEGAGATIFARIDHTAGAQSVDLDLTDAQLLIFGNPRMGTPAMQDDPLAGLYLPLRVLVYSDSQGQVWLAYENPEEMLEDLAGIDDDAPYIVMMQGALGKLTSAAVED